MGEDHISFQSLTSRSLCGHGGNVHGGQDALEVTQLDGLRAGWGSCCGYGGGLGCRGGGGHRGRAGGGGSRGYGCGGCLGGAEACGGSRGGSGGCRLAAGAVDEG